MCVCVCVKGFGGGSPPFFAEGKTLGSTLIVVKKHFTHYHIMLCLKFSLNFEL